MRRACSSDVSRFRLLGTAGTAASLAAPGGRSIEPEPLDLAGDRGWDETVDRPVTRDAGPDVARGDVDRLDLEEADAVGASELGKHVLEALPRVARARRDTEPRQLEHAVGILPAEEVRELVGADEKDGVV